MSKGLGQLTTFVVTLLLARVLEKGDFGLFAMAMFYIWFLDVFVDLGFMTSIVQQKVLTNNDLSSCFWFLTPFALGLFFISYWIAPELLSVIFSDGRVGQVTQNLAFAFLVVPFTVINAGILSRSLRLDLLAVSELSATVVRAAVSILLALEGFGVLSLVYGYLAERVTLALLVSYQTKWYPILRVEPRRVAGFLSFGSGVTVGKLLWFAFTRLDVLVVGRLLGAEILGIYSLATQIASAFFQFIAASYYRLVFPVLARLQGTDQFTVVLLKASRTLAAVCLPVFVGIAVTAEDLVLVLLGSQWKSVALPLQVLAIVGAMQTLSGLLPQAINAVGRSWINVAINFVSVVVFGVVFYWCALRWELLGILWAWLTLFPIRYLVTAFIASTMLRIPVRSYLRVHFGPVVSALVMAAAVIYAADLTSEVSLAERLPILVAVGVFTYSGAVAICCRDAVRDVVGFLIPSARRVS